VPFHPADVNYLAVLVAGVIAFAIGAIWYTALFGKKWRDLQGISEAKMKEMQDKMNPPIFFGGMMVSYFVLAYAMAVILSAFLEPTAGTGAMFGFFAWLAIGSVMMTNHIASGHKIGVYLIDVGCVLVYSIAMGMLLAVWR
jgi:Protein of unknown function (DUF1761)